MKKVHNGWYMREIFKVEPQVVWLTVSELGINVWTDIRKFRTKFQIYGDNGKQKPEISTQYIKDG